MGIKGASAPPVAVLGLCKFGSREHMTALFERGVVYMNPASVFANLEDDPVRADKGEGLEWSLSTPGARLQMENNGSWAEFEIGGPIEYSDPESRRSNLFCLFAFRGEPVGPRVDERNFEFGDTYVLFRDGNAFRRRVKAELERLGRKYAEGVVEYIDPHSHQGMRGLFRKAAGFSYQSEFRIVSADGSGGALILNLGDLRDIALIGETKNLNAELSTVAAPSGIGLRHRSLSSRAVR